MPQIKTMIRVLILMAFAVSANAQHPCYLTINRHNGLPSDAVYCVYQDSKGYIWLATGDGLSRYDGSEFVSYKSDIQTSLPGSGIQEDKYGRIWYENFDGYLYYTDSGKLKSINQGTPYYYIPFGLSNKHIFVTTNKGVNVYDLSTLKLVRAIELQAHHAVGMNNNYYVLADSLLYKISDDLSLQSTPLKNSKNDNLRNIFSGNGYVYVTTMTNAEKELHIYNKDLDPKLKRTISIPQAEVIQSGSAIDSSIYINTPSGCIMYSISGTAKEAPIYFKGKSISGVIKDRQNNYWFSTTNEGLYIVPDLNNRIYTIPGLSPNKLVSANDGFYAGTNTGELLHIAPGFDKVREISHSPGSSPIYYLYGDAEHVIYSSTGFTMLPANGHTKEKNTMISIKEVIRLDDKYYAFASSVYCGLLKNPGCKSDKPSVWDKTFGRNRRSDIPDISSILNIVRAKSVAYDSGAHIIFFATNKGTFAVTPDTLTEIKNHGNPIYSGSILAANGYLYALTSLGMVQTIRYMNDSNANSNVHDLPLTGITLMKRFDNELYLFGAGSLHKLNLDNGALTKMEVNIDIHGMNDIVKHNGELMIVTNEGIVVLHSTAAAARKPALFYINSVTANNKPISSLQPNDLAYNENNIAVSFSLLDFGTVSPTTIYYQLNDNGWKEMAKGSKTLQFPALSSGSYTLAFRLGQDPAIVTTLYFNIKPAFWKQWWFYLVCLLATVAAVMLYYKKQIVTRIKKLEAQRERMQLEQELGKSMLTSIRAQMNPHFFYNALNTIQAYIFMNDKTKASSYLSKFSRLTRIILEMSEAETVLLSAESETMTLYLELEKMRFDSSFEYDMQFIGIDNKEMIELPSMIIQPYVENAIKHGLLHKSGDQRLKIIFERINNILLVTIDDNGIGRKRSEELNRIKAEKYRSFSTKAGAKRMELLNKGRSEKIVLQIIDKKDPAGNSAGTRVVLTIPI